MTFRCEHPTPGKALLQARLCRETVPVLTTERTRLRAVKLADFETYADIVCGPRGTHVGGPMTREDAWFDFVSMSSCWMLHGHGGWAVEDLSGDLLGFVILGLEPGDAEVELGYLFTAAAEGHGLAFESAKAVRNFARDALRLPALVSYVVPENTRSAALAERLGASRGGTLDGSIIFVHWLRGAA